MIHRRFNSRIPLLLFVLAFAARSVRAEVVDFNDVALPNTQQILPGPVTGQYYNGPTTNAVPGMDAYGDPTLNGTFGSGSPAVQFSNSYVPSFGSWSGFAVSNVNDTTDPGIANQYAAITGVGAGTGVGGKPDNYGVAYGYLDQTANAIQSFNFDPTNPTQLAMLPHFQLPAGSSISSMQVTNTTYSALSMEFGDTFAKQFGPGDFFKLTAYGTDAAGHVLSATPSIYLANFLTGNGGGIVTSWENFNLSALSGAKTVYFNLSSSDVGQFGMNTPGTFAFDNIVLNSAAVPEPATLVLALLAGIGGAAAVRRSRRRGTA
jgi:hypothetical protein